MAALDRTKEALEEYDKAVQLDPADSEARMDKARLLQSVGQLEAASKELERAIEKNPNDVEVRALLAEYLLQDGDSEGAMFQVEAAVSAPAPSPDVLAGILVVRGNLRDRKEEFAVAIDDYTLAVGSDPTRGDAWFYLAGDLERTGRVAEARDAYRRALELCRAREEWKKFYEESASKLNQL